MNQILESSIVVRTLQWLARESIVASGVKFVLRVFARVDKAFARASAEKELQVDHERLASILRNSTIVRTVDAAFSAPLAAWDHSRLRPHVDDLRATVSAMPVPQRIRLLGWMLAVAVLTRATLYVLSGAPITDTTLVVWGIVLATAIGMMTASQPLAVGWEEWKRRNR